MKVRRSLLLLPVVAALSFGTLAPAQAADTDPVTDLSATAVQAPGTTPSFTVTASWTANPDVAHYTVRILDDCTGSTEYINPKDTSATNIKLSTGNLDGDQDYCLSVVARGVPGATPATLAFHTPALDTTAPNGTYKLNRTSGYITLDFSATDFETMYGAPFAITQVAADSDVASRKVLAGDGSAAKPWAKGNVFKLSYRKPGTFTPHVLIADQFGNVNDIPLPAVRVLADRVKPTLTVTKPADPSKISSWRTIRGTASDKDSGLLGVQIMVLEKRGNLWWVYNARTHKWQKGKRTLSATQKRIEPWPLMPNVKPNGQWQTSAISGLKKGLLHVEVAAADNAFNIKALPKIEHRIH